MNHVRLMRGMMTSLVLPLGLCACDAVETAESLSEGREGVAVTAIDLDTPWERHEIVRGSTTLRGADGVHLADVNGDGRLDAVSGYEQSHNLTVSLHPGYAEADDEEWPVRIPLPDMGRVLGPEDAVFADVDGDQRNDVIVGGEAGNLVAVFFAPDTGIDNPRNWDRMDLVTGMRTMRVAFANIVGDDSTRPEIVIGGKEDAPESRDPEATLGYFRLTNASAPREPTSWSYTVIQPVGWVMQMMVLDFDADGDRDIVYTDRDPINSPTRDASKQGLRWLERQEGPDPSTPFWDDHQISSSNASHKWFDIRRWDADADLDVVDCQSGPNIRENRLWLNGGNSKSWTEVVIEEPAGVGQCQHITFVNVDNAGPLDLGITYSNADGVSGAIWLHNAGTVAAPVWKRGEISGSEEGIKYDNLVWYDVDDDGDLDAVTSEQHEPAPPGPGLGVIWYENPLIAAN